MNDMKTSQREGEVFMSSCQIAERYDRRWAAYTERSLGLLRPFISEAPGRLLDVGCGTGALLSVLRIDPVRYVGVDLSAEMLRGAARHPQAGLIRAEAGALPLRDASFDLAVSASSLHDWASPDAGLREIRRVLAPGGRLLLVDWCADHLPIRLMRAWLTATARPVRQVYTEAELREILAQAGFGVTATRRARISPVWGMMVAEALPG